MTISLNEVQSWGYQLQSLSEPGAVEALAESRYDMLVIEPTRTDWSSDDRDFDTPSIVKRLKASPASDGTRRKLIIAYIDIGEAEDWRWYWKWSRDWEEGDPRPDEWPDYILTHDPDGWEGNYPVAYWDERWKDMIIYGIGESDERPYESAIDEVLQSGFDGIYLDWVEGYENEAVIAAAQAEERDPAEEMVIFIDEIRQYAQEHQPDFLIIQQNAAALIEEQPEIVEIVDAIAQEAVWFDGESGDSWDDADGYDFVNDDDLTNYYLEYLEMYQKAGLPVFVCEYARFSAEIAYAKAYARGFVPYVTRRSLSQLTTTPPPMKDAGPSR